MLALLQQVELPGVEAPVGGRGGVQRVRLLSRCLQQAAAPTVCGGAVAVRMMGTSFADTVLQAGAAVVLPQSAGVVWLVRCCPVRGCLA